MEKQNYISERNLKGCIIGFWIPNKIELFFSFSFLFSVSSLFLLSSLSSSPTSFLSLPSGIAPRPVRPVATATSSPEPSPIFGRNAYNSRQVIDIEVPFTRTVPPSPTHDQFSLASSLHQLVIRPRPRPSVARTRTKHDLGAVQARRRLPPRSQLLSAGLDLQPAWAHLESTQNDLDPPCTRVASLRQTLDVRRFYFWIATVLVEVTTT